MGARVLGSRPACAGNHPSRWRAASAVGLVALGCALSAACSYPGVDDLEGPAVKPPPRLGLPGGEDDPRGETKSGTLPPTGDADAGAPGADAGDPTGADAGTDAPLPPAVDAAPPKTGRWLAVDGADCAAFCEGRGETLVPSPEGATCTSGENIPASALAAGITYNKCYPSCSAHLAGPSPTSAGRYCYAAGQKRDNDASDVTRGCFCL